MQVAAPAWENLKTEPEASASAGPGPLESWDLPLPLRPVPSRISIQSALDFHDGGQSRWPRRALAA